MARRLLSLVLVLTALVLQATPCMAFQAAPAPKRGVPAFFAPESFPLNCSDPSGLETYVHFSDGTFKIVYSGTEFINAIKQTSSSNLITDIITRGHGATGGAEFTTNEGGTDSLVQTTRGVQVQWTPEGSMKARLTPLRDLLKGKLSDGARFFLNNCSTAGGEGDYNLANALSKEFAGHEVRGVVGTLDEAGTGHLRGLTGYSDSPTPGSSWKYYLNGKAIASPNGNFHPYTHFWQDSGAKR